jgi:sortase A
MKSRKGSLLLILVFLIGAAVFAYPSVSQWHATKQSILAVKAYENDTGFIPEEYYNEMWQEAVSYNEQLSGNAINDPFAESNNQELPSNYENILNINGLMGFIEIPKIKARLPVYHGVEEDVLQKGIGHMEGSALPIGSKGGHVLLVGHTGLPDARLFTDLEQLVIGDQFNIRVLNKELVYQVDQIKVVEPDNISELMTVQDGDYITLITCTPYGINSHRLLVRGSHVYTLTKQIRLNSYYFRWIFVGGGNRSVFMVVFFALLGLNLILLLVLLNNRRKKRLNLVYTQSKNGNR